MTNSTEDERGTHDAEPTTHAEPQGGAADDTSALLELTSLRSYFDDPNRKDARSPFSDWLRAKAHQILDERAGRSEDLFAFGRKWLKAKLLFGPAADIFAVALKKYGDSRDPFSNLSGSSRRSPPTRTRSTTRRRYSAALSRSSRTQSLFRKAPGYTSDEIFADRAETSALRGAIYRRLFDLDGELTSNYIRRSTAGIEEAHGSDGRRDALHFEGYGGINAAFTSGFPGRFRLELIGEGPILKHAAREARQGLCLPAADIAWARLRLGRCEEDAAGPCRVRYLALGLSRVEAIRSGEESILWL